MTLWSINGFALDQSLVTRTIDQIVLQQRHRGFSSDVSWGLYYALQFRLQLSKKAADALVLCADNCIALQALHLKSEGLLPKAYTSKALSEALKTAEPDGRDWLLLYEAHRQKFATPVPSCLSGHSLFADMLARDVGFYRPKVPNYAAVIQPGGAPEWVVRGWMDELLPGEATGKKKPTEGPAKPDARELSAVVGAIGKDVRRVGAAADTPDQLVAKLLDSAAEKRPDVGEEGDAGIEY